MLTYEINISKVFHMSRKNLWTEQGNQGIICVCNFLARLLNVTHSFFSVIIS